ncbi:hypothetical protein J437_LFUL003481 [Ladona fulva]|uniref:Uncharacterized protein n=1 Tax=Ladona fulva TaxID=123851 RepID=A0A8K0JWD5_LADFU|nr:hypothetical protein J437_LFUL003481 [Ladona fulva]
MVAESRVKNRLISGVTQPLVVCSSLLRVVHLGYHGRRSLRVVYIAHSRTSLSLFLSVFAHSRSEFPECRHMTSPSITGRSPPRGNSSPYGGGHEFLTILRSYPKEDGKKMRIDRFVLFSFLFDGVSPDLSSSSHVRIETKRTF